MVRAGFEVLHHIHELADYLPCLDQVLLDKCSHLRAEIFLNDIQRVECQPQRLHVAHTLDVEVAAAEQLEVRRVLLLLIIVGLQV